MTEETIPYHLPLVLSEEDVQVVKWKLEDCLEFGNLSNLRNVRELEEHVEKIYNVKYCIATNNATSGLFWCWKFYDWLMPLHMPNFTWPSFYYMLDRDVRVEFHDINPDTWLMEPSYYGGVVMPTHTFGSISEVKRTHNNKIIFDGAHSFGCKIKDIGDATVFSLAPTKLVTGCEGGLVITNDRELADFVADKRDKCCRMPEPNAIIALQTLQYLDAILEWKREVYEYYREHIEGIFQEIPIASNYNTIGFKNLYELNIPKYITIKQYYEPIKGDILPNAYRVFKRMVCLPSYYGVNYKKITKDIKVANGL